MPQHNWTYDRPHGAVRYDIRSPLGTVYATSASEKHARELVEKLNTIEGYTTGIIEQMVADADASRESYNSKARS